MAAKLTRLAHKIAIQLHLVAESCTICSFRSRRPIRKLLDTPSYSQLQSVSGGRLPHPQPENSQRRGDRDPLNVDKPQTDILQVNGTAMFSSGSGQFTASVSGRTDRCTTPLHQAPFRSSRFTLQNARFPTKTSPDLTRRGTNSSSANF
jgi:hypothetical protein